MTVRLDDERIRAILLDIEGTTTPPDFVYQVLFPYARRYVEEFLRRHAGDAEVRADIESLRAEYATDLAQKREPPAWRDDAAESDVKSTVAYVHWLMERDRKSTALKSIQGKIWEQGYRGGELHGQVYADVPPALHRWHEQGIAVSIFSSGSVLGQKLLFGNSTAGDLAQFIQAYFDTTTGAKTQPASYARIAQALGRPAAEVLFVSDTLAELDAARLAGMPTVLCVRQAEELSAPGPHPVAHSFDALLP